jgi:hypothetical protein
MAESAMNPFEAAYIAQPRAPKRAPSQSITVPVQVAFSPTLDADLAKWQRSGYSCIGLSDVVSKAGTQGVSHQLEEQARRVGAQVVLFCVWPAKLKSVRRDANGTIDLEAVATDPPASFSPRGYAVARALFLAPKHFNKNPASEK